MARCSAVHPSALANGCEFPAVLLVARNRWFCGPTITANTYRHALSIQYTGCSRALPVLLQASAATYDVQSNECLSIGMPFNP